MVTSHTGCVSRNGGESVSLGMFTVTSHTGCVSRNDGETLGYAVSERHIPHGMCE